MALFSRNQSKKNLPYSDRKEFLSEYAVYFDVLLLEKLKVFAPLGADQEYEKELLAGWLSERIPKDAGTLEEMDEEISSRVEMSNAAGRNLGIPTMIYNTDPSAHDEDDDSEEIDIVDIIIETTEEQTREVVARILWLSACMRTSARYEELMRLLSGRTASDSGATVGDMFAICKDEKTVPEADLGRCSILLSIFYLEMDPADDPLGCRIRCDDRLLGEIFGNKGFLPMWLENSDPKELPETMKFRDKQLEKLVAGCSDNGRISLLSGDVGAGKKTIARHVAYRIGKPLVICGIRDLLLTRTVSEEEGLSEKTYSADYGEIRKRLLYARRECVIGNAILLVEGMETGCETVAASVAGFIRSVICGYVKQIYISYDSDREPTVPPYVRPEILEPLTNRQRIELWKDFLDPALHVDNEAVEETGSTFEFTAGQIREAAERLASYGTDSPDKKLLHKACYGVLKGRLSTKAVRVESGFVWEDIKLYPREKTIMRDICNAVENRTMVMQDWNFKTKLPYGAGITVLFAGPPGTGKTMAASVIANELGMELYKVDSSRLIDKYVGETEKNIRAIFNLASRSNAILFFDEADSIFNKRMDAKDANERFANIESSLLLQCIEEYNGVVILATNKMSAMDPAFMRRFRFYIQFSEPDEEMAYNIWTSVFPKEAPLAEDLDFRELAHIFKFTGAVIKNISLQAAYLAAGNRESISSTYILKAARREMEKNHRVITREELGRLSYLYQDMMKD